GSAAYMPMFDGARYRVYMDPRGAVVIRPEGEATEQRLRELGWQAGCSVIVEIPGAQLDHAVRRYPLRFFCKRLDFFLSVLERAQQFGARAVGGAEIAPQRVPGDLELPRDTARLEFEDDVVSAGLRVRGFGECVHMESSRQRAGLPPVRAVRQAACRGAGRPARALPDTTR